MFTSRPGRQGGATIEPVRKRAGKMLGDGVIAGLRMEPELARDLRVYAENHAALHELKQPNVAAAARHLLREALAHGGFGGCHGEVSCRREGYFAGLAEARSKLGEALRGAAT